MAEIRWTNDASVASMAYVSPMPFRSASALTFLYALGYPIGALAVSALSPMAVLTFRFGLAAAILGSWALLARVSWPTGVMLIHVLLSGLLAQGVLFVCLYLALQRGAPAVLGAVVVSMNPVLTALLAAMFLGESLSGTRVVALVLGVAAVLAACAGRLIAVGGVDAAMWLLVAALVGIAAGGVYQQRFCSGVDFRVTATLQNAVCVGPVVLLASLSPLTVHHAFACGRRGDCGRTAQRDAVHDDVRAGDQSPRRCDGVDAVLRHPGGCRPVGVDDSESTPRCWHRGRPRAWCVGVLAQRPVVTPAA